MEVQREAIDWGRRGVIPMAKNAEITLNASRGIPFKKLILSQSNVPHVQPGVSVEEMVRKIEWGRCSVLSLCGL